MLHQCTLLTNSLQGGLEGTCQKAAGSVSRPESRRIPAGTILLGISREGARYTPVQVL